MFIFDHWRRTDKLAGLEFILQKKCVERFDFPVTLVEANMPLITFALTAVFLLTLGAGFGAFSAFILALLIGWCACRHLYKAARDDIRRQASLQSLHGNRLS